MLPQKHPMVQYLNIDNIAMDDHHCFEVNDYKLAILQNFVELPEGKVPLVLLSTQSREATSFPLMIFQDFRISAFGVRGFHSHVELRNGISTFHE